MTVRVTFWLLLPVLGLNLAFASHLPAGYQPAHFDRAPAWLTTTETLLRLPVFLLPLLLPLQLDGTSGKVGMLLYVVGLAAYAGSWALLIVAPTSGWSTSWLGFTAPAWTPAFWLTGVALLTGDLPGLGLPFARPYAALCATFLVLHMLHASWAFRAL